MCICFRVFVRLCENVSIVVDDGVACAHRKRKYRFVDECAKLINGLLGMFVWRSGVTDRWF